MKTCTKCGIEKPLDAEHFSKQLTNPTGFHSWCKVCHGKANMEYYEKNKEKIREQYTEYRSRPENKEKHAKKNAEYRKNNKEEIAKRNAEMYLKNRDKRLSYAAEYRKNNKEKILEQVTAYYHKNKEKILKQQAERYQNNKETNRQRASEYYHKNKEKRRQYRLQKKTEQSACVYQIVNSMNNKIYIGQTTRGELRWKEHLKDLRDENRKNTNHKLQADFNKFGEDAFTWSIIKEYPKDRDTLLLEEARTIIKYKKEGKDLYNIALTIDQVQLLEENK
tara:strand:- start:68 stop:901 length:834 start_codon:yes stop_codon:yes gene_type:complete